MQKIYNSLLYMALAVLMTFTACSPDDLNLGAVDVKPGDLVEGIAFTITHDSSNPNVIYLESKMGSPYTPLWIHPQGRSQEQKVTLNIAFPGTYTVTFGVETRGGVVYGEPEEFEVEEFYAPFVENEMWTLISGGVGSEKTWYLDLDADGLSRYFSGPLYFYGADDWYGNISGNQPALGEDSWNWLPDYAGNTWLMDAGNYGSMTFSLIDAATITVEHLMLADRGTETGTYLLDTDNYTLNLSDASILHDSGRDGQVLGGWQEYRIVSLTEHTMQIGVQRNPDYEGACLLVYNFISKDYFDNWTPSEEEEAEPTLPDGWKDDVSQTVTTAIKWVLSPETPFNWANLDGSLMNAWNGVSDYPDWTGFDASVPATYANFSLVMDSSDDSVVYTAPDGTVSEGSFTLDDKGIYTFSGVSPNFTICSWVNLYTGDENTWRITKITKNAAGKINGMWVGVRAADKDEYAVWYLIPSDGSSASGGEESPTLTFDQSKVLVGDLEGKDNLRIEFYNEYGPTVADPAVNPADVTFYNNVSVTFTISGMSFNAGAAGTYPASIYFANADWQLNGNGPSVDVTGNGTYTVSFYGESQVEAKVFAVDIVGIFADIADIDAVTVTIDKIELN